MDYKDIITDSVKKIIDNTASDSKIKSVIDKHKIKPHFIPIKYRVFGGLLQSMNIQFGNFIEILMTELIKADGRYEILGDSGKKFNKFRIKESNEILIDKYITDCQTPNPNWNIDTEFPKLLNQILINNSDNSPLIELKHDIDLMFKDKDSGTVYYCEIKYNDDHDTGKFVDINRKFIKTYAYLTLSYENLNPYLFFFTNKIMKGNIYVPENTNILRGQSFFDRFLKVQYEYVDNYLSSFCESSENYEVFDGLYKKIRNRTI